VSLIHDLDWSRDDHFLVSASGDGSAIVWSVENITDKKKKKKLIEKNASVNEGGVDLNANSPAPYSPAPNSPRSGAGNKRSGGFAFRVLHPSPSVVYAARFVARHRPATNESVPSNDVCPLVVTGSFDGSTLLWDPCLEEPNLGGLGALPVCVCVCVRERCGESQIECLCYVWCYVGAVIGREQSFFVASHGLFPCIKN
jgi:hypothetical protein